MTQKLLANHYNIHRGRKNDFMLPVRNFHNFVKARLIASVCTDVGPLRFLDFCCGNGGDIGKLKFHDIKEYFGLDIANEAVNRAEKRLSEQSHVTGDAICLNAFSLTCGIMLESMRAFDIVSCQFALHYAFRDEKTARTCIQNVSMAMTRGGHFIGTIPDSEYLLNARKHLGKRFGDRYHQVKFANKEEIGPFGDGYEFTFTGAVESLTEYLIHKQTLVDLCSDCGLELIEWRNFSTYNEKDNTLFNQMGAEFLPVSKIYTTFCFQKTDD